RVGGIALKWTIGTAEAGLAPVLVECRRYAGDQDAQREERDEDCDRTRGASRARKRISQNWSGHDSNIVSGAQWVSPWATVIAAFVTFAVSAGLMHSYPVFFVAFLAQFGWTRAGAAVGFSVSQLLTGAGSPAIGVMVDRLGPRRLVLLGGVLLAVGLALSAEVSSLWHLVALYGVVMTVGANCLGLVVFTPLVTTRFTEKRGLVLSIVQSANGFGRAASVPTVQFLISTMGWRRAYVALAALLAGLLLPPRRVFPP